MLFPHLINTETYSVEKDVNVSSYAILSHRWEDDEIRFDMLRAVDLRRSHKVHGACQIARGHGLKWLWVDSVCMDKSNATEETRSINSMFKWYQAATICLTYLCDVDSSRANVEKLDDYKQRGKKSVWFTRGWTLQELLAPRTMEFYDKNWQFIGTKASLKAELSRATGIDEQYLAGGTTFRSASVATRMSWMAGRFTRDEEDVAYSMLGIFDVNMPSQYGEGVRAFMRLQQALIESPIDDESLFAWTTCVDGLKCYSRSEAWEPLSWGILAPSPDCFHRVRDVRNAQEGEIEPRLGGGCQMTSKGVQFQVPQKSGTDVTNWLGLPRKKIQFALNCREFKDGMLQTVILHLEKAGDCYKRVQCHELDGKPGAKPSSNRVFGIEQVITRPLTIKQPTLN